MNALFTQKTVTQNNDNTYTRVVNIPQYEPKGVKPPITALYDYTKYSKLISDINRSSLTDEEKKFLKLAASRHIVFNYSAIADYYAHADKEMQELMEQSALVIIDMDNAIANGYVKLSKDIEKLLENTGVKANE